MRRFTMVVAGAFFGALVGSVAALLLAPSSGEGLRRQMRQRLDDFSGEIREAYAARRTQLESELDALRGRRPSP
jgi:gas vesicle protein